MAKRRSGSAKAAAGAAVSTESLLTPKQVCLRLGINRRTLRRWVVVGRFPRGIVYSHQTVRWPAHVVDEHAAKLAAG